jgi:hypothetical protein
MSGGASPVVGRSGGGGRRLGGWGESWSQGGSYGSHDMVRGDRRWPDIRELPVEADGIGVLQPQLVMDGGLSVESSGESVWSSQRSRLGRRELETCSYH